MSGDVRIRTNDRVCIFGRTGSGKTVLSLYLLQKCVSSGARVIIHDIKHELQLPYQIARSPAELESLVGNVHYVPDSLEDEDFNSVCHFVYSQGNIMLWVDEIGYYTDSWKILRWHKELLVRGRTRGVGVVHLSQRPRGIHNVIVSECNHFFVFQLLLTSDIDKLRPVLPQQYCESIPELPRYHYIYSDIHRNVYMCRPVTL